MSLIFKGEPPIIDVVHQNGVRLGDLAQMEDGYYYWWPESTRSGCYEAYILHEIVEKLNDLNKEWDAVVKHECSKPATGGASPWTDAPGDGFRDY